MTYLTHDKRPEGQTTANDTADRVEWSEFRNLPTENTDMAWRIMAATARNQDEIKRQAGASVAGNKSPKSVFHYSLAWHPDEAEGLTKPEMIRAADESIRALNAEGYQAVLIAHNDTAHPHVHVVINRVNLENGKMLDLWKTKENLSLWAQSYEQERGHVWCPQRVENNKRRELGETFSAAKDNDWHQHDQAQALGHGNDNDSRKIFADQKAKDAALAADGETMHLRHSQEWKDLSAWYKAGKDKIAGRGRAGHPTPFQKAAADVKAQFKPLRSALGKQQWREMKDFERHEKSILGKLENAVTAVKLAKELSQDHGGAETSLFNHVVSSSARKATLEKLHRMQWRNLNAGQSAEIGAAIAKVKKDQGTAYKAHRARFNAKREALKVDQAEDKRELRQNWQDRKIERSRAFDIAARSETLQKDAKRAPEASRGQMRADFNKAKRAGRKRKGRTRKPK